jgi:excisionase family DNA binding protein
MRQQKPHIPVEELQAPFVGELGKQFPPVLTPEQLADILGLSKKTIEDWIRKGRLDGSFRKRGKHNLIWRDRALNIIFNGKEWTHA